MKRVTLVGVAGLTCAALAVPANAWAGETAPGSRETLKVEAPTERAVGVPMTLTVQGTADGFHRLFVYGEAYVQGGCRAWPYKEQAQHGVVTVTSVEGEPLSAGHFSEAFVVAPGSEWYGVCAYLGTTAVTNPDVFEYGCYHMPAHLGSLAEVPNISSCFMSYEPWWSITGTEKRGEELLEDERAERTRREELEDAQRRQNEEAMRDEAERRRVAEEGEQRQATEEDERDDLPEPVATKRCRVPALRRHTLASARRLLRDANCRLGRVRTHHAHGSLVVKAQNPKRGRTLADDSAVSIRLGP